MPSDQDSAEASPTIHDFRPAFERLMAIMDVENFKGPEILASYRPMWSNEHFRLLGRLSEESD